MGDQVRARWCRRRGRRRCGADLTDECVRWLGRRSRGLGGDEHVGDHRLVVAAGVEPPLQPQDLRLPRHPARRRGGRLDHLCALHVLVECRCADQLVVRIADAILDAVLEPEDREESGRDAADHDRENDDSDHQFDQREPILAACGRWAFEPDSSAHPTADSDQRVRGSLAAAHRSSFPYDPEVTRDRYDRDGRRPHGQHNQCASLVPPSSPRTGVAKVETFRHRFAASPRYCS